MSTRLLKVFGCLVFLWNVTTLRGQVIVPINICYDIDASEETVQQFCRSVPECSVHDDSSRDCFRRCEGGAIPSLNHNCEDYGQVCHYSHVCLSPPVMLEDDETDNEDV
jgi:hypothetical protein